MTPASFAGAGQAGGAPAARRSSPPATPGRAPTGASPRGSWTLPDEALAAAQLLEDQGATGTAGQAELEAAVTAYLGGAPPRRLRASPTPTSARRRRRRAAPLSRRPRPGDRDAHRLPHAHRPSRRPRRWSTQYMPIYQAWITAGEPAMGGSAPDCPSGRCEVAATTGVFPWVPAAGFPDYYPAGQCTYWAAFNFDPFPAGVGGGSPQNLTQRRRVVLDRRGPGPRHPAAVRPAPVRLRRLLRWIPRRQRRRTCRRRHQRRRQRARGTGSPR